MSHPARLLLVDDHRMIRDGLTLLARDQADLEVVGEAGDAESAWKGLEELQPDLVVMDLDLPGEDGASLTLRIRLAYPQIKVVILTGHAEPAPLQRALQAGACGLVFKSNAGDELVHAIRVALGGGVFLSPEAAALVMRTPPPVHDNVGAHGLTSRETEVLRGIAEGHSTKEIAFALKVSAKTVESHRARLMEKVGVKSIAELTKFAIRIGLTQC